MYIKKIITSTCTMFV